MLEAKIDALIAVIEKLTAAVQADRARSPGVQQELPLAAPPATPVADEPAPRVATTHAHVTLADVKSAVATFVAAHGRDKAVALLQDFGANRVPDLQPEQYAAFLRSLKEAA